MKLATFVIDGQERWGLVITHPLTGEDWVFDPAFTESRLQTYASRPTSAYVATRPVFMPDSWPTDLVGWLALANHDPLRRLDDFLRRFLEDADTYFLRGAGWPLSDVKLRAPVPRPRLMFGLVQNSPTVWRHIPERKHLNVYPQGHQRPLGTVIDPDDAVILPPADSIQGGWNPELGVIIGRGGRDIPVSAAMRHVAGYTVVSDVTVDYFRRDYFAQPEPRDWLEDAMSSWGDKKSDARFPIGPFLVTPDEVGNPYDLMIYTRQSGHLRDRSHTGAMHIGIERTISWLSSFRELQPGDVIHMGTMGYDGSPFLPDAPPAPDEFIESEIERVGVLRNPVRMPSPDEWRTPTDRARSWFIPPAVHELREKQQARLDADAWQVGEARHLWTVYGNYQTAEVAQGLAPRPYPRFLCGPASSLAVDGHRILLPGRARSLKLGVELACVVGEIVSRADATEAEGAIAGYLVMAVVHDESFATDVVEPASAQERELPQVYARWGDGYTVVSAQPRTLPAGETWRGRECRLTVPGIGEVRGTTDDYQLGAAEVIAYISRYITLFPGDVVTLGRLESLLPVAADRALPAETTVQAGIDGLGHIAFTFDDQRDSLS